MRSIAMNEAEGLGVRREAAPFKKRSHASYTKASPPQERVPILLACLLLVALVWTTSCGPPPAQEEPAAPVAERTSEATSLLGEPLHQREFSDEERAPLELNLAGAQAAYDQVSRVSPDGQAVRELEAIVWLGRRLAYLWRYQDAIDVFTDGIEQHPEEPHLYRHRGHRYITLRQFDKAVADLTRAAELVEGRPDVVEPDGAPNAQNIPRSTLQSNIWYHLALAHYLLGDFEKSLEAWRECMKVSKNDDMIVATSDWLYMTLRRLGREDEATTVLEPIHADMEILENFSYHRRLLMYKGELLPEALLNVADATSLDVATQGYGVGNWYFYNGQTDQAEAIFGRILEGDYWAAFGYIAAEAEMARLEK